MVRPCPAIIRVAEHRIVFQTKGVRGHPMTPITLYLAGLFTGLPISGGRSLLTRMLTACVGLITCARLLPE